jgi:hypothetical protein
MSDFASLLDINRNTAAVTYSGIVDNSVVNIEMIEPQVIMTSVTDNELIVVFR